MLRLVINGQAHECAPGSTILSAVRAAGLELPTLCDDQRLEPSGACRLCLVEVKGQARPVTSCNTHANESMEIQTHTPALERLRRTLLRLLAEPYPADPLLEQPDKSFHRYLRQYGLEQFAACARQPGLIDSSHPCISVDMSRCIHCYRCVRICDQLQGQSVWRIWGRGAATHIRPDSQTTLLASSCVSCGACADTCPTGAIDDRPQAGVVAANRWIRSTCPYCGTGCEIDVGEAAGTIVQIKPVLGAPVSKGHLCAKGRYAFGFNNAPDRITSPMIRQAGNWKKVSWTEAIAFVANRLQELIRRHGPDSVGILGCARATNEDNYLTQKFARVVIGTNNVDCCARVCHAPTAAGLKHVLGTGAATNCFDDIERARTILICGANPMENHPVVGARIKQAAIRGAKLIVVDPRRIELAEHADSHLQIHPGSNIPLLNALANTIINEGWVDDDFLRNRVDGWETYCSFIAPWTAEGVAAECGVEASAIRLAASLYATIKPSICFHGLGITEHFQGTDSVMCLVNLALLTGNLGKPGTGINPLRGQNNVQGAAVMGCDPSALPGAVAIGESTRTSFEQAWHSSLPRSGGLNAMQMMDGAAAGRIKAMWIIGYDVALTHPNAASTGGALRALDLLIVQDLFLNETARQYATVFLPAASSFEKDGTFMNSERRISRVRKVVEPPGDSLADWQIICAAAGALGHEDGFAYEGAGEIWDEVRSVWPAANGISYQRLEDGGLQWPCSAEDHPGTAILHTHSFSTNARAILSRVDHHPLTDTVSPEYPFLLNTGRTLHQFNAGTMTSRSPGNIFRLSDLLEINPEDASRLRLQDGQLVCLRSKYGQCEIPVAINPAIARGELFATFHSAAVFLNQVIGSQRDRTTDTPQYKLTPVTIEKCLPK